MENLIHSLRSLPNDIAAARVEPGLLAALTDADLVRAVAHAIAAPKKEIATSFVLHAPLELLARAALLPLAPPSARTKGRLRIAAIAARYAAGEEIEPPSLAFESADKAQQALVAGLRDGDRAIVDAAFMAMSSSMAAEDLASALGDEIAARLGAAAHTPLLLSSLPVASAHYGELSLLLRGPLNLLAREPDARLAWVDSKRDGEDGPQTLEDALAAPPRVESPSRFIAPTMLSVEADGLAASLLSRPIASLDRRSIAQKLARIAALSMLQDDPDHAPFGWTHCLTLPQGVLALGPHVRSSVQRLGRIAATFVLGFRATLGQVRLAPFDGALGKISPLSSLAARAIDHDDAHLAKYTVACLAAAAADPPARSLFMAAATRLGDWWDLHPNATFGD